MANESYEPDSLANAESYSSVPMGEPVGGEFESSPSSPNMGLAILRRWPWLLVGAIGGIVLGLLYHTQRPPVYQANAQLLVIKNRAEVVSSPGGGNASAVAVVEDYVTTQVTLLRSQQLLAIAARSLNDSQLTGKPPAGEKERVDFLLSRFSVVREREAGSNTLTNVLALTFRSGAPGDCPQYLHAIIDAYRKQLASIYEEASTKRIAQLDTEIDNYKNDINGYSTESIKAEVELRKITQEEIANIRGRITTKKAEVDRLRGRETVLDSHLKLIDETGPSRQLRLTVLVALGQQARQSSLSSIESKNPQDVLFTFELSRQELAQRFGKDHPEMQALDSRIRMLKQLVSMQAPEVEGLKLDELAVYALTLRRERETIVAQRTQLDNDILDDANKVLLATAYVAKIDEMNGNKLIRRKQLDDKEQDKKQTLITRTSGGYSVQEITRPGEGFQVAPILYQSILFGTVLGLAAGFGLALSMELTDRSFRSPAEIRRRLGLPILGHIPRLKMDEPPERNSAAGIERSIVGFYRPTSTEAEAYRGVRTQLYFSTQGRGHQVIMVTSPNPGDGKSTLAANLAVSIAQSGKRVVLMDCDFRKPRIHKLFKLDRPEVGLASVMSGDAELGSAIQTTEIENLSLLPCGPRPANPAELLTTPRFQEVLKLLRERFEFVIVDTPPVLAVSDPSAIAPRVDGVMLVFRMTKNARPVAERAREQLAAVGARILGVIVNASSARSAGYGGYGYAYQYEYQYAESYTDEEGT